jgi:hypothetical protein
VFAADDIETIADVVASRCDEFPLKGQLFTMVERPLVGALPWDAERRVEDATSC